MLSNKWIEIDSDAIKNNLEQIRFRLANKAKLIAVVKANAYGHGLVETAQILSENGVDFFAVTYLDEALELRKANIKGDILIFSPLIDKQNIKEAIKHKLTLSITSLWDAQMISKLVMYDNLVKVHIKLDTGLGRFGFSLKETKEICDTLKENSNIHIEGIYTHMAEGGLKKSSYTKKQYRQFTEAIRKLEVEENLTFNLKHCANSAVFLNYEEMWLDAVRIGTLISGQLPVGVKDNSIELVDPYVFKTKVIAIKQLERGKTIGYFRSYKLTKNAKIAVIPVGFNDGLAVDVVNKPMSIFDILKGTIKQILRYFHFWPVCLYAKINGCTYPIRGKVFMQMALIEIPINHEVKLGNIVEVPIRKTIASSQIQRIIINDRKSRFKKGAIS
ncbi:Alanine racemase [Candidatus Syntrophocurvum alkaliphilum]|uniref:Alanine racemase n=1 Tax=Candidatus Syntrophocurvum alkaliphilum TaxID=2293317 RepID=A0A6I6DLL9_9FIRM|nr:alanine racemase [Candidatus Syntrophocurvum alkaliphilum]QGU00700.1 Alanine racemase [Candidatus Syntrophocurvum alkaliphilum]